MFSKLSDVIFRQIPVFQADSSRPWSAERLLVNACRLTPVRRHFVGRFFLRYRRGWRHWKTAGVNDMSRVHDIMAASLAAAGMMSAIDAEGGSA